MKFRGGDSDLIEGGEGEERRGGVRWAVGEFSMTPRRDQQVSMLLALYVNLGAMSSYDAGTCCLFVEN